MGLAGLPGAIGWPASRAAVVALGLGALAFEITRITVPAFSRWAGRVTPVYRSTEAGCPSGALWLALGYVTVALLPGITPAAFAAGISVAALTDPAASLAGSHFARGPGKSWAGTCTAVIVGLVTLGMLGQPWRTVIAGALVGAAAERWSGPLNDNLVVAPTVALAVMLLA